MKKTLILSYLLLVAFAGSLFANEVNIFSARHYTLMFNFMKSSLLKQELK